MVLIELSLRQRYGETFIAHFFNVRRFHFQSRINPTGCISLNASVIASAIILWSERINTVYCYFTESSNIPKFSGNLQLHVGLIDWTHATHCHFHHACQFQWFQPIALPKCEQLERSSNRQEPFNYCCERLIVYNNSNLLFTFVECLF